MKDNQTDLKISVAMATYNGAKFIEQQLKSIINQTRSVDEIVISDDGSNDDTLQIVRKILESTEAAGIDFVILTDNPRHGYCGNFEHAISHCTGDYIFLADQDDIWLPDKVERILYVYVSNPNLQCVFHKVKNIDKNNNPLSNCDNYIDFKEGIITQRDYLEQATSGPLCAGMVMCISKHLLDTALPFPLILGLHDQWLVFCALCVGDCYYIDEVLALYRYHENNVTAKYHGSLKNRILKVKKRVKEYRDYDISFIILGEEMKKMLKKFGLENTQAYDTAEHICRIGAKKKEAFESNRVSGAFKLTRLFVKDKRYRKCGTNAFLYQLAGILTR